MEWNKQVLDVEKTIQLELTLRKETENKEPILVWTIEEVLKGWKEVPKEFILKVIDENYDKAKVVDRYYEYISEPYHTEAFRNPRLLRLIGIHYKGGFWDGWTEVTVQIAEKKIAKNTKKEKVNVLVLGFHVERVTEKQLLPLFSVDSI